MGEKAFLNDWATFHYALQKERRTASLPIDLPEPRRSMLNETIESTFEIDPRKRPSARELHSALNKPLPN